MPVEESLIETSMPADNGTDVSVVQLIFKLSHEVKNSLLDYMINE